MSFQRLAVFDFYRTGQQDCANVFGKDEVREALLEHPSYDDRRLLDDILENTYAVRDQETKDRWLADQDFEGLDPEKCWAAYQRGWADQALSYIKSWRPSILAERAERENPDPKDATMFKHRPNPRHGRPLKTYTVVRVNRNDADTYAVEGDGAAARAKALELAGPDPGDAVEYAVVQATDAGAARLTGRTAATFKPSAVTWRPLPVPRSEADVVVIGPRTCRRHGKVLSSPDGMHDTLCSACEAEMDDGAVSNPRDPVYDQIVEGMARALWVTSWANYCEELPASRRAKLREEGLISGAGGDWDDAAPLTPPTARLAAKRLARAFEERNGVPMTQLLERAAAADGGALTSREVDLFGHYLAMQALGHGVSWFDDHAKFPLQFPFYTEAHYDGRRLHVNVRGA